MVKTTESPYNGNIWAQSSKTLIKLCQRPYKQNKTKQKKHVRPAPDVYIKLVRLFDPEGISFLTLILFSIMDSTTYQEITLYLSTKWYTHSLRNNFKRNFRRKCTNFAIIYIGHYLGLSMKSSTIKVGPIQQSKQTRAVASFPSFMMQKESASDRIVVHVHALVL